MKDQTIWFGDVNNAIGKCAKADPKCIVWLIRMRVLLANQTGNKSEADLIDNTFNVQRVDF